MWVANAAGQVEVLDLKTGKMAGALKGATGSVRAMSLHSSEPILASVGLDRFLRLHSTASRKQLAAVYLKQKLTGVSFCAPPAEPAAEEGAATGTAERDAIKQGPADAGPLRRKRPKAAR